MGGGERKMEKVGGMGWGRGGERGRRRSMGWSGVSAVGERGKEEVVEVVAVRK